MTRPTHFSRTDRVLHWTMAMLFLRQFTLQWWHGLLPEQDPGLERIMGLHSLGVFAIFFLGTIRLAVRLRRGAPPLPNSLPVWQRLSARLVKVVFYIMFFVQPVTGVVSVGDKLPKAQQHLMASLHMIGGWTLSGLIVVHLSAAL